MQTTITLRLLPSEAANSQLLTKMIAQACATKEANITGYTILKQSIDARGRKVYFQLTIKAFINEPYQPIELVPLHFQEVHHARRRVIVVGAGPAGLFASLRLIEQGIKPIIVERGKDVRARRRDLALINKEGVVNPESNYCFGEGGAGTYSDGKLYTRSTKRGDVNKILSTLVHFGAADSILYEAHPHIGTNKLPHIITAIREKILECGGEVLFEKKVIDLLINNGEAQGVKLQDGELLKGDAVILATGHSARDIFEMLHHRNLQVEFKPFALGVRVEHPQALIDSIQYHCSSRGEYLPPASYSLVQQVASKGVFSFCMCPGGIIAPAATNPGEVVVNGWSPSKRNNPYANSGIVVTVDEQMTRPFSNYGPLAGMYFQSSVEQKAFEAGGGKLKAPAQRLEDFVNGKDSASLPGCSYLPGIHPVEMGAVLPGIIYTSLQEGFKEFGKKMKGYLTNDAVVVATESRTSSPVRIPRTESLEHPQVRHLYPCAEGAGYAGGIVSAAMDGERVAERIGLGFTV